MNRKNLLKLIEEGENNRVEFKQKFSSDEKIAKEAVAFANTKGGLIIFGVDDRGNIVGVQSEKEEAELALRALDFYCFPKLELQFHYIDIFNKELVVLEILESKIKPVVLSDHSNKEGRLESNVYIRVNDKSVPASREMIKILRAHAEGLALKNYFIGKNEKIVFDYLNKNGSITVKILCDSANISNRRASRTLIKMTRAGLLSIHVKDNGEEYFTYYG